MTETRTRPAAGTSTTDTGTGIPPEAAQMVMEGRRRRLAEQDDRRRAGLADIQRRYLAQRATLITAEAEEELRRYMAGNPPPGETADAEQRRRHVEASRAFAEGLGIDLSALARLNESFDPELAVLLDRPEPVSAAPATPEGAGTSIQPGTSAVQWGSWDSGGLWYVDEGDGHLVTFQSYLNPTVSQTGSVMVMRIDDSGNNTLAYGWWENGYLVDYVPPTTGYLLLTTYLQCNVDDHVIATSDEWGFSSCFGKTMEFGVMELYSDWNDWSANDEQYDPWFVPGLKTTAINGGPGLVRMFYPGATRQFALLSGIRVFAGVPLLVYAATRQEWRARCNDVDMTIGVNSAWKVNQIRLDLIPG